MKISKNSVKRAVACAVVAIVVLSLVVAAVSYLPTSRGKMTSSVALVECRSYYAVKVDGKRLFCFNALTPDTLFERIDTAAAGVPTVSYSPGCWVQTGVLWPSCRGRLVAHVAGRGDSVRTLVNHSGARLLACETDRLQQEEEKLSHKAAELKYYLNVHGVQDEGFNSVSEYDVKVRHDKDSVSHILALLRRVRQGAKVEAVRILEFTLLMRGENGKLERRPCRMLSQPDSRGFVLLQTADRSTPAGICAQSFHRWLPWRANEGDLVFSAGYDGMNSPAFDAAQSEASLTPGHVTDTKKRLNMPRLLTPDGSPVFSQRGCFLGLAWRGQVVETDALFSVLKKGGAR